MTARVNRRVFLRGLGGAAVAAPFLGSIADRAAKAEPSPAPGASRRLIVMFTHYGCVTTRFFPVKSHGALVAADLESTTLAPLVPHVSKLVIPRGIRAMNEWTTTLARGQGNDPHLQVTQSYFTCCPVTLNSNNPFDVFPNPRFPPRNMGPSLDHVIAQQLSAEGVPLVIRLGNRLESFNTAISFSAPETLYQGVGSPAQVFSRVTGLFAPGPASPDSYRAARGQSIVDLVRGDLETLERFDMSRSDRLKLEAWKDLLDRTGRVVAAECSQSTGELVGATQANIDAATTSPGKGLAAPVANGLDGADVYSAVAVLAAACELNPVIVLKYPNNYVFAELGLTLESHCLSHRLDNAAMQGTCLDGALDMLHQIDGFYARKFAKLVGMLDSISEGEGTLLDQSAAVWFQEMSDGAAHNLNNLPIIQAGSAGGYFKTGWTVNVDDGSADLTRGNSELACVPGAPATIDGTTQSTGTDPQLANAPINKYFCSLMNALGVKAGEDGFPAVGGRAPVTKFGMYDKTEDFIGGGTNPPMIHDPGELEALKA